MPMKCLPSWIINWLLDRKFQNFFIAELESSKLEHQINKNRDSDCLFFRLEAKTVQIILLPSKAKEKLNIDYTDNNLIKSAHLWDH